MVGWIVRWLGGWAAAVRPGPGPGVYGKLMRVVEALDLEARRDAYILMPGSIVGLHDSRGGRHRCTHGRLTD